MVRFPRRTHSVSGPPSAHCILRDVACCCNLGEIRQFYMSMMALRRNPQRWCKKEELASDLAHVAEANKESPNGGRITSQVPQPVARQHISVQSHPSEPFRFFDLPRELRHHVYSYLVVRRGKRIPVIEAKVILRRQKKRSAAQRTRERLNLKRLQNGKRPVIPREPTIEPIIHLNVLQASRDLYDEVGEYMYQQNWFAISLDNFPISTVDTPFGWDFGRITRLQLELQLKDAQRMNNYVDWSSFFHVFPSLRFIRVIPTFHTRYYEWAQAELATWDKAHYVFRAFFRELLASIPEPLHLKLGPSPDPEQNMLLEGRTHVSRRLLQHMYTELGARRDHNGEYLETHMVVD